MCVRPAEADVATHGLRPAVLVRYVTLSAATPIWTAMNAAPFVAINAPATVGRAVFAKIAALYVNIHSIQTVIAQYAVFTATIHHGATEFAAPAVSSAHTRHIQIMSA